MNNEFEVTGLDRGAKLKVKFNPTSKTLEIYAGQTLGTDPNDANRTLILVMYALNSENQGYISWSDAYYYKGVFNGDFNNMAFTFQNSGTWTNYNISGLYMITSSSVPPASGSYSGVNIYLKCSIVKK